TVTVTNTAIPTGTSTNTNTPTVTPTTTHIAASCTTPITGTLTGAPLEHTRLNRTAPASACGVSKPCPGGVSTPGPVHYRTYIFTNTNSTTECITINLSTSACGSNTMHSKSYHVGYKPDNICDKYLGDAGSSST